MDFYQSISVIQDFKTKKSIWDLSTGDPYIPSEIKNYLIGKLNDTPWEKEISKVTSYGEYDGSVRFINKFKKSYEKNCHVNINNYEIIVTAGAQIALRYLHELFLKTGLKILFPACYEYSGAFYPVKNHAITCDLTDFLSGV